MPYKKQKATKSNKKDVIYDLMTVLGLMILQTIRVIVNKTITLIKQHQYIEKKETLQKATSPEKLLKNYFMSFHFLTIKVCPGWRRVGLRPLFNLQSSETVMWYFFAMLLGFSPCLTLCFLEVPLLVRILSAECLLLL